MASIVKVCALLLFVGVCAAQQAQPVTEVCLGCICQAVSGCDITRKCDGQTCGLFQITWAYWSDAGKPTLNGVSPDSPDGYSSCVNNPFCAAQTVQGYMAKYGQDCNGDGKIDCLDQMAIHKNGPYACSGNLSPEYSAKFNQCIAAVAASQG